MAVPSRVDVPRTASDLKGTPLAEGNYSSHEIPIWWD